MFSLLRNGIYFGLKERERENQKEKEREGERESEREGERDFSRFVVLTAPLRLA